MKRYLPLLGVFLLFFLVMSGFAYGARHTGAQPVKAWEQVAPISSAHGGE
ncbi:hypothetical protein [Rufibacter psychrotolerans]|nr:hypothetical protein [Rufibacter sp. SYSU D00308]